MEIQAHLMHHNPYDIVKSEEPSTPPKAKTTLCPSTDMLFSVSNFNIQSNFCPPVNNNHDPLNNNHVKISSNGRTLAADRKRPYPCNLCTSRFGSKMELEEHQNSHTGMKPFECDVCKARFNRRSTLWNHKRIHSDAKPFVCTVCQMTFKWKNSLKCHKEMHLRKNESTPHIDNDLRQLTYATAAKRKLMMDQEEQGNPATSSASSIHSQPLITTTTPKKKSNKSSPNHGVGAVNLNPITQPLQASALIPPSDHQLDLDTSSLDTLVNSNNNLLMHIYNSEVDPSLTSRHTNPMLNSIDDNMLNSQLLGDIKSEPSLGGATTAAPINVHLPMQLNMLNFRPINAQQLPSVHHLTSTSLPVSVPMDYTIHNETPNVAHPQYIVTTQPDMMLPQGIGYQHHGLDQCVILTTGHDYVPNFDYPMIGNYQMQAEQHEAPPQAHDSNDEKIVPYEQW
ncbi:zinc finger, C2H2 type [Oesophagostomum dentatum]|uniref:Zinc finger, C2H2 type n=1 Tax=Oesophagostomum dentatum TaxID=61180 RepID=A0A0B1TW09_OESDE|nr:zinc finger, C2H2 type [Oesophagostomum dentatum]